MAIPWTTIQILPLVLTMNSDHKICLPNIITMDTSDRIDITNYHINDITFNTNNKLQNDIT